VSQREYLKAFSLPDLQQALFILLDILIAAVRKRYSGKPRKIEKFTSLLSGRMHDLLLQASKADAERREKTAARAESKYARLLDMANDAIFVLNYDSALFTEVNKAACQLTGYSESELKRMGFNSLVSVFDLNLAIEKANTAIERGAVRFDDLSILTKKGVPVPVDISASAVTIDDSRYILAIMRDIKERKAFEKEIEEKADRLKLINNIARTIGSADLDIEAVLTTILKSVARVIKVEAGSVLRLEDAELVFMVALGEKAECVKPFRLRLGQGIAGWVAQTGEGLIVRNVHNDPRYYPEVERATGFVSKSILAVPMKIGDSTVGVIELINKIGGQFTKKDLELISAISSFAAIALEHARLFSECELSKARLSRLHSSISSSRLAAVVAHEMKDPLGIIKNYVRILGDRLGSTGAQPEELAVVHGPAPALLRGLFGGAQRDSAESARRKLRRLNAGKAGGGRHRDGTETEPFAPTRIRNTQSDENGFLQSHTACNSRDARRRNPDRCHAGVRFLHMHRILQHGQEAHIR
jgi:PAS domain S-box-containing protein